MSALPLSLLLPTAARATSYDPGTFLLFLGFLSGLALAPLAIGFLVIAGLAALALRVKRSYPDEFSSAVLAAAAVSVIISVAWVAATRPASVPAGAGSSSAAGPAKAVPPSAPAPLSAAKPGEGVGAGPGADWIEAEKAKERKEGAPILAKRRLSPGFGLRYAGREFNECRVYAFELSNPPKGGYIYFFEGDDLLVSRSPRDDSSKPRTWFAHPRWADDATSFFAAIEDGDGIHVSNRVDVPASNDCAPSFRR